MVNLLLSLGARFNEPDINGDTPLHYAVRWGPRDVVLYIDDYPDRKLQIARLLLLKGARVGAKNSRGDTPLDLARDDKDMDNSFRKEITELLRAYDPQGENPKLQR